VLEKDHPQLSTSRAVLVYHTACVTLDGKDSNSTNVGSYPRWAIGQDRFRPKESLSLPRRRGQDDDRTGEVPLKRPTGCRPMQWAADCLLDRSGLSLQRWSSRQGMDEREAEVWLKRARAKTVLYQHLTAKRDDYGHTGLLTDVSRSGSSGKLSAAPTRHFCRVHNRRRAARRAGQSIAWNPPRQQWKGVDAGAKGVEGAAVMS
jgi:hypothetical protein